MRYIQPAILRTQNASDAIQSIDTPLSAKPFGLIVDCWRSTKHTTPSAYEADEWRPNMTGNTEGSSGDGTVL